MRTNLMLITVVVVIAAPALAGAEQRCVRGERDFFGVVETRCNDGTTVKETYDPFFRQREFTVEQPTNDPWEPRRRQRCVERRLPFGGTEIVCY